MIFISTDSILKKMFNRHLQRNNEKFLMKIYKKSFFFFLNLH